MSILVRLGITASLLVLFLSGSTSATRLNGIRSSSAEESVQEQTQAMRDLTKEDHVQFVFVIGLESSGHHLLEGLVAESPAVAQVKERDLESATDRLQKLMHPLLEGVCDFTPGDVPDMELEQWKFVSQLERVKKKLSGPEPQTVFFNAQHAEISYPLGTDDCRQLRYPDLDALYAACDQVGATCGHVYMHRDPYEVLNSAKLREINPTVMAGIKTYYSMLNIIYAQLSAYSERTLGCWGFFDGEAAETTLWQSVQELLLWGDKNAFYDTVRRVVQGRRPPLTADEQKELVPSNMAPAMASLLKAHDRTLQLCRAQARQNAGSIST